MTAHDYREALSRLGLTQAGAAELLGYSARMSRYYANGRYTVPTAVEYALKFLLLRRKKSVTFGQQIEESTNKGVDT